MSMPCPNDEVLADYIEGRLSEDERFEVEDHLSVCERCLEDFVVASHVLREHESLEFASVPANTTQTAVHLVQSHGAGSCPTLSARLKQSLGNLSEKVSDFLSLKPWTGGMQLEPIRGSKTRVANDLIQLRKKFKDFDAEIEIEKTGESKAHIRVNVPGESADEKKPVRVTLKRGDRDVASHLLSGTHVLFEDVPFGHYGLIFSRDGAELGEYHFEITENRHGE